MNYSFKRGDSRESSCHHFSYRIYTSSITYGQKANKKGFGAFINLLVRLAFAFLIISFSINVIGGFFRYLRTRQYHIRSINCYIGHPRFRFNMRFRSIFIKKL